MLRRAEAVTALVLRGTLARLIAVGPGPGPHLPALTLLSQDRVGLPIKGAGVHLVDRFDEI